MRRKAGTVSLGRLVYLDAACLFLFLRQEPQRHRLEAALLPILLAHQKDVFTNFHALINDLLQNLSVMGNSF